MISHRRRLAVVLALFAVIWCANGNRVEGEWEPVYEHGVDLFESTETIHMCNANDTANWYIYCSGKLLEAVNYHNLFNDSKDFVDMPLVETPEETRQNFEALFANTSVNDMNKAKLQAFVDKHFSPPGSELTNCTPADWVNEPANFQNISDPQLKQWAMQLNGIWKHLCKQIRPEIKQHISKYSLIYVPNQFIAPGGRFREFYYWDAYWIIKGLLASGMHDSAAHMIRNLADMVTRFGFVPNGGRVYYLRRSQPPMLTGMLYDYYEATHNLTFVREILPIVQRELNFWDQQRSIRVTAPDGTNHTVYRYRTASNVPRPESFKEDMMHSAKMNESEKQFYYRATASSAESGWDFSTRWFKDHMNIETIETHKIIPVDLNAIVCWNLDILEYLNEQVGNFTESEIFRDRRAHFRETVEKVFYNDTTGAWHDFSTRTHLHNTNFYPSVAVPLFTGCYNDLDQSKSERLYTYIENLGAFNYAGGVPSSLISGSGEQWDFPNGWSPSQHFLIEGLRKSENPKMQDQAFRIATKWVQGNYKVFKATSFMWEKYNVIGSVPQPGKGGEYEVQDGFGWTNGVILDLLLTYSDRLSMAPIKGSSKPPPTPPGGSSGSHLAPSLILPLFFSILLALHRI